MEHTKGRMRAIQTLNGLGGDYGPCLVKGSVKKSFICDEVLGPVP